MSTTEIKERPIPFNGEMVRAILEGRKTQTRRIMDPQPSFSDGEVGVFSQIMIDRVKDEVIRYPDAFGFSNGEEFIKSRYGKPGDRLWVQESWQVWPQFNKVKPTDLPEIIQELTQWDVAYPPINYRADGNDWDTKNRPPRFMPRWASRITLEITNIRAERVQNITNAEAYSEGVTIRPEWRFQGWCYMTDDEINKRNEAYCEFRDLWNSIYTKGGNGWGTNPWVWVIEFKVLEIKS